MDSINVNGVLYETQLFDLPREYVNQFDFIDFGAKYGKMRDYCGKVFGTSNGLHIEIVEKYIDKMEEDDIPCIQADITNLNFEKNCVDFSVCTHTIEHLPDLDHVEKVMKSAFKVSKHFVLFTWPFFDEDKYLKEKGFIPFWSTWAGHVTKLKTIDFAKICHSLGKTPKFYFRDKIHDSNHTSILDIKSPINSGPYVEGESLPKEMKVFDRDIYYEVGAFIGCGTDEENQVYLDIFLANSNPNG